MSEWNVARLSVLGDIADMHKKLRGIMKEATCCSGQSFAWALDGHLYQMGGPAFPAFVRAQAHGGYVSVSQDPPAACWECRWKHSAAEVPKTGDAVLEVQPSLSLRPTTQQEHCPLKPIEVIWPVCRQSYATFHVRRCHPFAAIEVGG